MHGHQGGLARLQRQLLADERVRRHNIEAALRQFLGGALVVFETEDVARSQGKEIGPGRPLLAFLA